jgi:hypothetical protein
LQLEELLGGFAGRLRDQRTVPVAASSAATPPVVGLVKCRMQT